MRRMTAGLLSGFAVLGVAATALADGDEGESSARGWGDMSFRRIATMPNYVNRDDATEATVSEIVAATKNGRILAYTDAFTNSLGFIWIGNPHHPMAFGTVPLKGSPTSVDILGNRLALVGVDTTEDLTNPTGYLAVIDVETRAIKAEIDLGGQPDSLKISPDGKYVAIAIESQRDEELCVGGSEDGLAIVDEDDYVAGTNTTEDLCEDGLGVIGGLPQPPAGFLAIVDVKRNVADWTVRTVDLTGLSAYGPTDPEPEFVDINEHNQAVVTLQENNHVVTVDLWSGAVTRHFDAGSVDLIGVDSEDDGIIALDDSLPGVAREPDAVTWIPAGGGRYGIALANEGDLFGGSRGFTFFDRHGNLRYDSGNSLEQIAVRHGHYPEGRSDNKGTEPEAIEYGRYGGVDYLFVASERGSFVAVYKLNVLREPEFVQLLPAPLGPEGVLAIPERNLLIVSGEEDGPDFAEDPFAVRSTVMIYKLLPGEPKYPQILSGDDPTGAPIPWSALSGMVAAPGGRKELLAVWDSAYAHARIFTIDASSKPAVIKDAVTIQTTEQLDPEGIAVAPDGTYWLASEGNASDSRPNQLLRADTDGTILAQVGLPQEILDCRAASENRGTLGSGFEGLALLRNRGSDDYKLLVAQQRGWIYTTAGCTELDDELSDDPAVLEPAHTRIWIYDPVADSWDHIAYELEALGPNASWVGLSEITEVGDGSYILIERDNRTGDFTDLKTLVRVKRWAGYDGTIAKSEKSVYDLVPALEATKGWITDKPEGVAVTGDGTVFVVTDNDGVDEWSGETWFFRLGHVRRLFR